MPRRKRDREPCTWKGCVYYDVVRPSRCNREPYLVVNKRLTRVGYSCLTFKEDLEAVGTAGR